MSSSSPPPLGNLPGLHWDPERRRYFPVSGSTSQAPTPSSSSSNSHTSHQRRTRTTKRTSHSSATSEELEYESTNHARVSSSKSNRELANRTRGRWKDWNDTIHFGHGHSKRQRAMHAMVAMNMIKPQATWIRTTAPPVIGSTITAMKVFAMGNSQRIFIGDSLGWLFTSSRVPHGQGTRETGLDEEWATSSITWNGVYQVNLHPGGEVSSIHASRDRCIATCFGPMTRICVERFDSEELPQTTLLTLPYHIHDVRSSCLLPTDNAESDGEALSRGVILGAAKKAVYIPDVEYSSMRDMRMLKTDSDVFCVTSGSQHIVYTGCRNGGIKRFDLRSPTSYVSIEPRIGKGREQSSVAYMHSLKDYPNEIVVGWMNGELHAYDPRFLGSGRTPTPTRTFRGHVGGANKHTHWGSAIDVTPSGSVLFGAGEDGLVRAWSLRSCLSSDAVELPRIPQRTDVVRCLSALEGEHGNSQLWASTSQGVDDIWRWNIG